MGSRVDEDREPEALERVLRALDTAEAGGSGAVTALPPGPTPAPAPRPRQVKPGPPASEFPRVWGHGRRQHGGPGVHVADEIRDELRAMLLLNRSTFPLGTLASVVVLTALAWPHVAHVPLAGWTSVGIGVVLMFAVALYPPVVNRSGDDGLPILIGPAGHACGALFAAAPWLDLQALRVSPWRWICLIMLFAMTSGTQSGMVSGTRHLRRVVVPVWLSASAAYAVIGDWVVSVAALVYLTIILRDHFSTRKMVIAGVEARVAAHRAALTDPLTGLANRAGALAELERLAAEATTAEPLDVVLLYIDLDRFKQVNDTHGHLVGDAMLVEASRRLLDCCREGDLVARLGGDEFLVVLAARPDHGPDTHELSRRIIASLERGFHIGGRDLFLSASVGVAGSPDTCLDPDDVIGRADKALYSAKRSGRRRAVHFSPDLPASAPTPVAALD